MLPGLAFWQAVQGSVPYRQEPARISPFCSMLKGGAFNEPENSALRPACIYNAADRVRTGSGSSRSCRPDPARHLSSILERST